MYKHLIIKENKNITISIKENLVYDRKFWENLWNLKKNYKYFVQLGFLPSQVQLKIKLIILPLR